MADDKRAIILDIEVNSKKAQAQLVQVNKALKGNREALKDLDKQYKSGALNADQYAEAQTSVKLESASLRKEASALTRQITNATKANRAAEGSYNELSGRLSALKVQYKNLSKVERESEIGKELTGQINSLQTELKGLDADQNVFVRNVGNYGDAFNDLGGAIKGILPDLGGLGDGIGKVIGQFGKTSGGGGGAGSAASGASKGGGLLSKLKNGSKFFKGFAAVAAVVVLALVEVGKVIKQVVAEFSPFLNQINTITGLVGEQLTDAVGRVSAISKQFNADFQDLAVTAKAVSEEFGISFNDALDNITEGFLNGADASGEYISNLREYSSQLSVLGLSIEETNALILLSEQNAIFDDKAIDALKEAGIRLRELTPATRDALNGIGLVSDDIEASLRDGSVSLFEVIQQVGGKLEEISVNSPEYGAAIADIFAGAGEDAGPQLLELLSQTELSIDAVSIASSRYIERQEEQLEATERLDQANAELADSYGGVVSSIQTFATNFKAFFIQDLATVYRTFTETIPALTEGAVEGVTTIFDNISIYFKSLFIDLEILYNEFRAKISFSDEFDREIERLRQKKAALESGYEDAGDAAGRAFENSIAISRAEVRREREAREAIEAQKAAAKRSKEEIAEAKRLEGLAKRRAEEQAKLAEERAKKAQALEAARLAEQILDQKNYLAEVEKLRASNLLSEEKYNELILKGKLKLNQAILDQTIFNSDTDAKRRAAEIEAQNAELEIRQDFVAKKVELTQNENAEIAGLRQRDIEGLEAANAYIIGLNDETTRRKIENTEAEVANTLEGIEKEREARNQIANDINELGAAVYNLDVLRVTELTQNIVDKLGEAGAEGGERFLVGLGAIASGVSGLLSFISESFEVNNREDAEKQRKLNIASIVLNGISAGAQAFQNALASPINALIPGSGIAIGAAQSAIIAALTLAQVNKLKAQPLEFSGGGFTGDGYITDSRKPGRRIAGVVHDREYVVPTSVLRTSQGSSMVNSLERMRTRGSFAAGGFTTPVAEMTSSFNSQNDLMRMIQNLPNPVVSVKDINTTQKRVEVKENTSKL